MLDTFSQQYDYILLDSPPVLTVTDAHILGTLVAGTVFVIRSGKTTHEAMQECFKKIKQGQIRLLGVILNGKDFNKSTGYSYYYYGGYYSDSPNDVSAGT